MSYAVHRPGAGWLNVSLTGELRPLLGYSEDAPPVLACSQDPDMWFADPSDGDGRDRQRAKDLCWACPIRPECLLRNLDEPEGIFGAFDAWERRMLREGIGLCRRCSCMIPAGLSVCIPCAKLDAKDKARARLRAAAAEKREKSKQ